MIYALVPLALMLTGPRWARADSICATHYSELGQTARLKSVTSLFGAEDTIGLVNQTGGSFVELDSHANALTITFYTTGFLDLYPIKRDGPLEFCDDGEKLIMSGVGRTNPVVIENGRIVVGDGGPKMNFGSGPMPDLLRRKHKIPERGLASEK
ncbi:MAG: hypothetical protein AB7F86_20415 [Bdellovibrionales bacterium]